MIQAYIHAGTFQDLRGWVSVYEKSVCRHTMSHTAANARIQLTMHISRVASTQAPLFPGRISGMLAHPL